MISSIASLSSSSLLLYVHRDHNDYWGRGAQGHHFDFYWYSSWAHHNLMIIIALPNIFPALYTTSLPLSMSVSLCLSLCLCLSVFVSLSCLCLSVSVCLYLSPPPPPPCPLPAITNITQCLSRISSHKRRRYRLLRELSWLVGWLVS